MSGQGRTVTDQIIIPGDARVWATTIEGPINCIVTDPPYGMKMLSNFAVTPKGLALARAIDGDEDVQTAILLFIEVMEGLIPALADDADIYVFTGQQVLEHWITVMKNLSPEITYKKVIVWDKGNPGMGDLEGDWSNTCEFILYAKKGRHPIRERRSSIISIDKVPPGQMVHPTQKPTELMEVLINQSTNEGDLVVDPFSGSGATLLAARACNRNAIGIEVDDEYVNVIRDRLSQSVLLF